MNTININCGLGTIMSKYTVNHQTLKKCLPKVSLSSDQGRVLKNFFIKNYWNKVIKTMTKTLIKKFSTLSFLGFRPMSQVFFKAIFISTFIVSLALPLSLHSQEAEAEATASYGYDSEMDQYRAIVERKKATRQDLADVVAMQFGQYDQLSTPRARIQNLREKTKLLFPDIDINKPVTRGEVAKAVLELYPLEQGVMYQLTGWQRYALKDVQSLNIIPHKFSDGQIMSGMQLLGVINVSVGEVEKKTNWGK